MEDSSHDHYIQFNLKENFEKFTHDLSVSILHAKRRFVNVTLESFFGVTIF